MSGRQLLLNEKRTLYLQATTAGHLQVVSHGTIAYMLTLLHAHTNVPFSSAQLPTSFQQQPRISPLFIPTGVAAFAGHRCALNRLWDDSQVV